MREDIIKFGITLWTENFNLPFPFMFLICCRNGIKGISIIFVLKHFDNTFLASRTSRRKFLHLLNRLSPGSEGNITAFKSFCRMPIEQSINLEDPWKSKILAIMSCKTSLRERIAQACYWKLKLLSSDTTKHIKVFLASTDNDKNFVINERKRDSFQGKSRNRIISEYELDGVYILREDFRDEWESKKVKKHESIFNDLIQLFEKK